MKPEVVRVNKILSLIAGGTNSVEIIRMQEERQRSGQASHDRGDSSEQNVRDALLGLPIVSAVYRIPQNSPGDHKGIDMVVELRSQIPEGLVGKVRVQVKSGEAGIRQFRERIMKEQSLTSEQEVDQWLIQNELVLLNGQLPPDIIATNFNLQLDKINDFARTVETRADRRDIEKRKREQARRYWDYRRSETLTSEWRSYGERHAAEVLRLASR